MTTQTLTLADFILARIAEDEAAAFGGRADGYQITPVADGIATTVGGARLRAECEAKRQIVKLSWHHLGEDDYGWGMEEAKRQILALLALPYAEHEDFRDEWRP